MPIIAAEEEASGLLHVIVTESHYAAVVNDPARKLFKTRFLGTQILQQWSDLQLWDTVFEANTGTKLFLELGTGWGAMSMFFLMECIQIGAKFVTVDQHNAVLAAGSQLARRLDLYSHFWQGDMWGDLRYKIDALIDDPANHPMILFCDGGNKPKEMQTFGPMLKPGDIIAHHDFGGEIDYTSTDGLPLRKIFLEESEATYARTRWFERV